MSWSFIANSSECHIENCGLKAEVSMKYSTVWPSQVINSNVNVPVPNGLEIPWAKCMFQNYSAHKEVSKANDSGLKQEKTSPMTFKVRARLSTMKLMKRSENYDFRVVSRAFLVVVSIAKKRFVKARNFFGEPVFVGCINRAHSGVHRLALRRKNRSKSLLRSSWSACQACWKIAKTSHSSLY